MDSINFSYIQDVGNWYISSCYAYPSCCRYVSLYFIYAYEPGILPMVLLYYAGSPGWPWASSFLFLSSNSYLFWEPDSFWYPYLFLSINFNPSMKGNPCILEKVYDLKKIKIEMWSLDLMTHVFFQEDVCPWDVGHFVYGFSIPRSASFIHSI